MPAQNVIGTKDIHMSCTDIDMNYDDLGRSEKHMEEGMGHWAILKGAKSEND